MITTVDVCVPATFKIRRPPDEEILKIRGRIHGRLAGAYGIWDAYAPGHSEPDPRLGPEVVSRFNAEKARHLAQATQEYLEAVAMMAMLRELGIEVVTGGAK